MPDSLLELPPELLVEILALLPLRSLLKVSQTCHGARMLAYTNLNNLNLHFCTARRTHCSSSYNSARRMQARGGLLLAPNSAKSSCTELICSVQQRQRQRVQCSQEDVNPYRASIQIPDAHLFDYITLTDFQSALTASILTRHSIALTTLDLSLWALTVPIAKAITGLAGLRSLAVNLKHCPYTRAVPRPCILTQRQEERKAWDILTQSRGRHPYLKSLKIKNAELDTEHVIGLIEPSRCFKELSLSRCNLIGKELWSFVGSEWNGRNTLEALRVSACGGILDEMALDAIGKLARLQYLDITGCIGVHKDMVENMNDTIWRIPHVMPPKDRSSLQEQIIEVDPAYMT